MLLDLTLKIIAIVFRLELRRISRCLVERRNDNKQAALMHVLGVDLVMLEELNKHLIFFLLSKLVSDGLAVEVEAIDVVGREKEDVHHVVIEEIG